MINKEIGVVGLGRMGFGISSRLKEQGYHVVGFDLMYENKKRFEEADMQPVSSLEELCTNLKNPKIIILLIPAGKAVTDSINSLTSLLDKNDVIMDFGNSYYKDSISRSAILQKYDINFMDVGLSGGIGVSKSGGCLTVGGKKEQFLKHEQVFKDLAVKDGYMYVGPTGWGHLVKMVHNGIEYGFLQAIGEGLNVVNHIADDQDIDLDLSRLCKTWSNGSIIESRLLKDAIKAMELLKNNTSIKGSIGGGETGTWARITANEYNIPIPALNAALEFRNDSKHTPSFAGKVIAAIRNVFGGHEIN